MTIPCPPETAARFHSACARTARVKPTTGATRRGSHVRLVAATPTPMPVSTVNIGCANGDMRQRATNVAVSDSPPPWDQATARYCMFSVKAKPAAHTPA